MTDPEELLEVAVEAAAAGADVALAWFDKDLRVEEKAGPHDLVSRADREAEAAIREVLERHRPSDAVLGEEGGSSDGTSGVRWAVDPIDGTTSYLYGRTDWAVSVAATDDEGRLLAGVVAEPALGRVSFARSGGGTWTGGTERPDLRQDDLQRAVVELNLGRPEQKARAGAVLDALVPRVRDVRRGGSAAAALANVATGRSDAAWLPGLQPWDCAAGALLVVEAGGTLGDLSGPTGDRLPDSGDILVASPVLWPQLQQLLAAAWT